MTKNNPLLDVEGLPRFAAIRPEHVGSALDALLVSNQAVIGQLESAVRDDADWESFAQPLEDLEDRLQKMWSPVSHLNAVADTEDLRDAYQNSLEKLTAYRAALGQNKTIFQGYRNIQAHADFSGLDAAKRKVILNAVRDFRLSGVELEGKERARFKDIITDLATLSNKFEHNVMDATDGWALLLDVPADLAGLPESAITLARKTAESAGHSGWQFTLQAPSYMPFMRYSERSDLRRQMYEAFVTRASDRGPQADRWDNTTLMTQILGLRQELAALLGYSNYAEYALVDRMASSVAEVEGFLIDLISRARPQAQRELQALEDFAGRSTGDNVVAPWDIAYHSEKLRQATYHFDQEELRPYFPLPRVLSGLFEIVNRLFGITVTKAVADVWHPDVMFYEIRDEGGEIRGRFYLDLYAREHKRSGAWMAECVGRYRRPDNAVQTPVAFLTCNFTQPLDDKPALLTHDDVITLFHEFGHGLHHLLSLVEEPSVTGISGVPWDAVELPSQFLENWCWEQGALDLVTCHVDTGEPLPDKLLQKLRGARNFQSGMQMVRQLEFGLFDFRLHASAAQISADDIQRLLDDVRQQVAVVTPPPFDRFPHAFSHIFSGGYAAGYYGYLWAEVLSADAYNRFEQEGVFNTAAGRAFLQHILETGGVEEPLDVFRAFRGREPSIDAFLRHWGLNS
ncbi:MAG TPA: M3 family peptidase [Gammaproteobacteria bacterium]|jgi:oligopeptidase A|nr:M3 family metallopeptidase [Gammaproteobacteria bacterium]RTZ62898.1 MAG: oligopeptidase A [Gammaproteobacteria bacterium]HAD36640.1 oligopeptidase A [Gammaproteobacteria bacterium]HHZ71687.1 M3 family peptidase [Gammaproteobacteria bacterium]HIM87601.1 M3 family peptidase [Gammaproteobacteria bacterium]